LADGPHTVAARFCQLFRLDDFTGRTDMKRNETSTKKKTHHGTKRIKCTATLWSLPTLRKQEAHA
jgi:hypothetical protein